MWHYIADLHLGHGNIIKYCKRPFLSDDEKALLELVEKGIIPEKEINSYSKPRISQDSIDKMDNTIIDNINAVVGVNDKLVIIGDFCWTQRNDPLGMARKYRNRIKCKEVFLICGNHDDRKMLAPLFTAIYDQYMFNVNGQRIFTNHYPCRSWDMAHDGSWMLYGHVHDLYHNEDNGKLMPYEHLVYSEGFDSVLENFGMPEANKKLALKMLLDVAASTKGIDLTMDVGVDNIRPDYPFGTPWSMTDLHSHFKRKMDAWHKRGNAYRKLRT